MSSRHPGPLAQQRAHGRWGGVARLRIRFWEGQPHVAIGRVLRCQPVSPDLWAFLLTTQPMLVPCSRGQCWERGDHCSYTACQA